MIVRTISIGKMLINLQNCVVIEQAIEYINSLAFGREIEMRFGCAARANWKNRFDR